MIIHAGPILYDSPLGVLHLDRQLDDRILAVLVDALRRSGYRPGDVVEVELGEGYSTITTSPVSPGGKRRVRLGGRSPKIGGLVHVHPHRESEER